DDSRPALRPPRALLPPEREAAWPGLGVHRLVCRRPFATTARPFRPRCAGWVRLLADLQDGRDETGSGSYRARGEYWSRVGPGAEQRIGFPQPHPHLV